MSVKHFSLAIRAFFVSLAFAILWRLVLVPWFQSRGSNPSWIPITLAYLVLAGSLTWLVIGLQRGLATASKMAAFRLRYRLDEDGQLPPGFAQFLTNLAQEARHVVLTLMVHKGSLRMYLEVPADNPPPEGFVPVVRDFIPNAQVLPEGEYVQTPRPLTIRPLTAYAVLMPKAKGGKGNGEKLGEEDGGRAVLRSMLKSGSDGEIRWHLWSKGQGLVTIAARQQDLLRGLSGKNLAVRRIPKLVLPVSKKLPDTLVQVLEWMRKLYWWWPLFAEWGGPLAEEIWLPPTIQHPELDSSGVRLPLPEGYELGRPALIVGYDSVGKAPVGVSLANGVPGHLLVAGGGAALEQFGLGLVDQAIRLGMGVVAVGDHFDGLGAVYNSLPPEKRDLILRISPLIEHVPHIGLLTPQGGQPGSIEEAAHWLVRFLESEGLTRTAHRDAVLLFEAITALGLQKSCDFDLFELSLILSQAADVRDLLEREPREDLSEGARAFLQQGEEIEDWRLKSYAALFAQRMPMLRERWPLTVTRPPYVNLCTLLEQGGGLFCSFPLKGNEAVRQLARYVIHAAMHALPLRDSPARPVLFYLGDFPLYFTTDLLWDTLREQSSLVVLSAASVPETLLSHLSRMHHERFFPLVLRPDAQSIPDLAGLLAAPAEALRQLQGRNAVLQIPHQGQRMACTLNVLEVCPPSVKEEFPFASLPIPAGEGTDEKSTSGTTIQDHAFEVLPGEDLVPGEVAEFEAMDAEGKHLELEGPPSEELFEASFAEVEWEEIDVDGAGEEMLPEEEEIAVIFSEEDLLQTPSEEPGAPEELSPRPQGRPAGDTPAIPPVGTILDHRKIGLPDLPEGE